MLIPLLEAVESGGRPRVVGDGGKAVGVLQLHGIYVQDVNRISGKTFSGADRLDPGRSREMATLYLNYWGRRYERETGKSATPEVLARIHNGGPQGWQKKATLPYWRKVQRELEPKTSDTIGQDRRESERIGQHVERL
jgi:soluble lytic murein transglycosylase-like protein